MNINLMKNKNLLKFIGIFMIGFTMLTSCSSDNTVSVNNSDNSVLFDKWWYDSNNFAADLHFYSNGNYEQRVISLGIPTTGTGNWTWVDQNNGIMKINNLTGNGQFFQAIWLKFSDIKSNSFTLQQSANGTDYSIKVFYKDTDS